MRLLIFGPDESHVGDAEWALLALGTNYQLEKGTLDYAIAEWPLTGFTLAVIVGMEDLTFVEDFLTRCPRTPYSPPVLCVGKASSRAHAARLLDLGADDFLPFDDLEDLGPTKVQVLLRRERLRIRTRKRASAGIGLGRPSATTAGYAPPVLRAHAVGEPVAGYVVGRQAALGPFRDG